MERRKKRRRRQTQPTKPNATAAAARETITYTRHAGKTDRRMDGQRGNSTGKHTKADYVEKCGNNT